MLSARRFQQLELKNRRNNMASLNKVFLMGNLTRDPELRDSGPCKFGLAVNRTYIKNDEKVKEVRFFNIIVWGKSGENCKAYLKQGRPVLVEGRMEPGSYENKEGQKVNTLDIIANNVTFLGGGDTDKPAEQSQASKEANDVFSGVDTSDKVPF